MLADLFDLVDGLARFIGWGAIILGVIWLVSSHLEEKRQFEELEADRAAMYAFEKFLKESNPDRYNRYRDLKQRYALEDNSIHWHSIALECGVPRIEILKDRRGIEV